MFATSTLSHCIVDILFFFFWFKSLALVCSVFCHRNCSFFRFGCYMYFKCLCNQSMYFMWMLACAWLSARLISMKSENNKMNDDQVSCFIHIRQCRAARFSLCAVCMCVSAYRSKRRPLIKWYTAITINFKWNWICSRKFIDDLINSNQIGYIDVRDTGLFEANIMMDAYYLPIQLKNGMAAQLGV